MTERFTVEESEKQLTIYDYNGLDDYYHLGNDTRDVKGICNLLNELHEENRTNQKIIRDLTNQVKRLTGQKQRLEQENQILQSENEDLNEELLQLTSFKELLKSRGIDLE